MPDLRTTNNFLQSGCFFEAERAIHNSKLCIHIQISCLDILFIGQDLGKRFLLALKLKLHI